MNALHHAAPVLLAVIGFLRAEPTRVLVVRADEAEARKRVEDVVEGARQRLHIPGCSVAVVVDGRIAWTKGFGVKKWGVDEPVTPDTLFQAASISKSLAASAALRLVEQGRLALDKPVNDLLTTWQLPDSKIAKADQVTLRRLLCHGAGLSVHGFAGYLSDEEMPQLQDVLDGAKPANSAPIVIEIEPGKKMQYSGGGYCVVQQLMMDASGEAFPVLMRRLVLEPLRMTESTYEQPLPETRRAQAAVGHRELPLRAVRGIGFSSYPEMAAAGLWTTPSDLCRFAIAIQDCLAGRRSDFLDRKTVREMLTPQVSAEIGLGLFLEGDSSAPDSRARFSHDGANEGFRCKLLACREQRLAAAVMTNSDGGIALCVEALNAIQEEYAWPRDHAK